MDITCSLYGIVEGKNATHANIYLNDYIRIEYDE
jgi:hypothetical protein